MFSELLQDPAHCIYVWLARVLDIDQNVIQVDNDKDVQFLGKDFVNVTLEASWSVGEAEGHDLIFKVAIPGAERGFPLVTLFNSHLMIGTSEIQLGKPLSTTQPVQGLANSR